MATTEVKPEYQGLDEDTLEQLRLLDAWQPKSEIAQWIKEDRRQGLLEGEEFWSIDELHEFIRKVRR